MILALLALLLASLATGPMLGVQPNSGCYVLDGNLNQVRPCRPEETR
jgi:hypothetical protein